MSVPATVIYFTVYDHLKYALGYRENDPNTRYIPSFAGALSRGKCDCDVAYKESVSKAVWRVVYLENKGLK